MKSQAEKISFLEKEINELKEQLRAKEQSGLSKSDHLNYVNQLHEFYRAELDKTTQEKADMIANYQACTGKL
jgi:DNA phosphorothioation-dependent restriction protein DptG